MIDLDSKRELFSYFDLETRSLILEFMESIFGPAFINPDNIGDSLINEIWPRFHVISNVNFTVNSPLVPCILSVVNVKPTGVLKLFCDHLNLAWNHLNNIPSRPLTGITKCPQYAVTRNFVNSMHADMNFSHCLSPLLFPWSGSYQLFGFVNKRTVVHLRSYKNRRRRFFRFIKQRNQNLVRFFFLHRYSPLRTLFPLAEGLLN